MPLVLHDNAHSSNAQKVRFLLAELGQTAELRDVPFAYPRPDWHLAVNPLGGIPAIVHDGYPLAESNTVLALPRDALGRHPDLSLRPARPRHGQLAARRDRDLPAPRAAPDRGGRVRPARRQPVSVRSRRRPTAAAPRSSSAAEARALPGPARRRLAVGLLRPLHDRRRRGDAGAPPPAPQRPAADGASRASRPGSRPAASGPPGRASPPQRASNPAGAGRPAPAARRIEPSTSSCGMPGHWKRNRKRRRAEALDVLAHLAGALSGPPTMKRPPCGELLEGLAQRVALRQHLALPPLHVGLVLVLEVRPDGAHRRLVVARRRGAP